MHPVRRIMAAVDRHLAGPAHLRLLGGAALHLGYGATRATEDAGRLMEDAELEALIETANLGVALNCRRVAGEWERLSVSVLGPIDLILSKMCRADEGDLADISHVLTVEALGLDAVEAGFDRALVPEAFVETFARARVAVAALLRDGSA